MRSCHQFAHRSNGSDHGELPLGDTQLDATIEIDARAEGLPAGDYVTHALVVVGMQESLSLSMAQLAELVQTGEHEMLFTFIASADRGLQVVDEGAEEVAMFEAAIASGNPEAMYRGLSLLVAHHRARERYDRAEQTVTDFVDQTQADPRFADLHRIFRFWNVDDRFRAGDVAGSIALLDELRADAPASAVFLGESFAAQALTKRARIHRSVRDFQSVANDYAELLLNHFGSASTASAIVGRADALLEIGNFTGALSDYGLLISRDKVCRFDLPLDVPAFPCPAASLTAYAERQVRILQSDRGWYRDTPEELVQALRDAIDTRDITVLDAIASAHDFKVGIGSTEGRHAPWAGLTRIFMRRLLDSSPDLGLIVPPADEQRQVLFFSGIEQAAGMPATGLMLLQLENTPFGWQWAGADVIVFTAHGGGGGGGTSPGGQPLPALKAPWSPGVHMRAGGLVTALDYAELTLDALLGTLLTLPSSRCGVGIPGYHYNSGGHTGQHHHAIDYMQGAVLFCFWEGCLAPHAALAKELVLVARSVSGSPVENAAFGDPVRAAHSGIVVDSDYSFANGNWNWPNHVDIGIWQESQPVAAEQVLAFGVLAAGASRLELALNAMQADFWLENLHLKKGCTNASCPSRGMWVQQGSIIGFIDDTGNSFTSHLHFAIRERPAPGVAGLVNWISVPQVIEGNLLRRSNSGECIQSTNQMMFPDGDGDGIADTMDNCILVANRDQLDLDGDMVGDVCDEDIDNDGIPNELDDCPTSADPDCDFDNDGILDKDDDDIDGDGVPNEADLCHYFDDNLDMDGDGQPDDCDPDTDGDGFNQICNNTFGEFCGCMDDEFPLDPGRAGDHDEDGVDSLVDTCPCDTINPGCQPLDFIDPRDLDAARFFQLLLGNSHDFPSIGP